MLSEIIMYVVMGIVAILVVKQQLQSPQRLKRVPIKQKLKENRQAQKEILRKLDGSSKKK